MEDPRGFHFIANKELKQFRVTQPLLYCVRTTKVKPMKNVHRKSNSEQKKPKHNLKKSTESQEEQQEKSSEKQSQKHEAHNPQEPKQKKKQKRIVRRAADSDDSKNKISQQSKTFEASTKQDAKLEYHPKDTKTRNHSSHMKNQQKQDKIGERENQEAVRNEIVAK